MNEINKKANSRDPSKNGPFNKLVSHVVPSPVDVKRLEASFEKNAILEEFADLMKRNIEWTLAERLNDDALQALELLKPYLETLVAYRCNYVAKARVPAFYRTKRQWVIPSVIAILLQNVGYTEDKNLGIIITPAVVDEEHFLDPVMFQTIEDILRLYSNYGFDYSPEMPNDPSGSWELMSMSVIDGQVLASNNDAHPSYALLASFLHFNALSTLITPRVMYGTTASFKDMLRELVSLKEAR